MSIFRYRNDNPRTASDVADAIENELNQVNSSAPTIEGTQNYAFIQSFAHTIAEQQEQSLNDLYDAAYITDADGLELTKRARELGVQRQDAIPATGVVNFTRSSPATTDYTVPSGTIVGTGGNDNIQFETTETASLAGPGTETDSTTYSTTSTTHTTLKSFTVDVTWRDTIDVAAEIRIDNSSYTAEIDIVHDDQGVTISSGATSSTSFTAVADSQYDVSSYSGTATIQYQLRTTNASGTAELRNAEITRGGETGDQANVRCTETGPAGNVGSDTISTFLSQPAGIEQVTNPQPTGDPSYTLTNGITVQQTGQDREDDASLRSRALDSTAVGGAGTAEAAELALENIDNVVSADVFTNRSDTTVNNVDPWHTEVRVYGGDGTDIARRLYEVLPLPTIKTLQGGANGTLETITFEESDLYGQLDIEITRPTEIPLEITIDLVHDATYAGAPDVKDAIVNYVGGTTTDARSVSGIGQGEDVIVNEVENVAEDITGVDAVTNSILDDNSDGSDDTSTDSDGVQVYAVTGAEVATVDADDITINETAR